MILPCIFLFYLRTSEPISVKTSVGTIRGRIVDAPQGGSTVAEYLGIPFAQPPLEQLRYADPEPLDQLPTGNVDNCSTDTKVCSLLFVYNDIWKYKTSE